MTGRKRYHDRSHDSCCCSHPTVSIFEQSLHPGGITLPRNIGCLIPDHASILVQKAGRKAGTRTGPSTSVGGLDSHHYADLLLSGIHVSEKYLAFDEEPCYYDSQPEPPLFTVSYNNFTINQKGVLGYFFMQLNRTLVRSGNEYFNNYPIFNETYK